MTQRPGLSQAHASYLLALLARPALQFARTPSTAQVLGRADIALGCARKAIGILQSIETGTASTDDPARLHINARIAEVVSLNTIGLRNEARAAIASGVSRGIPPTSPGHGCNPSPEERSNSITGFPRASIYDPQRTADMALDLVPDDPILRASVTRRLADIYLTRPTARPGGARATFSARET